MSLEQAFSAFFLIAVLVLVLPSFFRTNSKLKQFFNNLFIWSVIVLSIVIVLNLILK